MDRLYFDLESTSADATTTRIVQLALLIVDEDGNELMKKSNLINPGQPISESATAVHGITDEIVKDKPKFADYAKALRNLFENKILIGYNILKFDIPVLLSEFDRAGVKITLSGKFIDVMRIETALAPRTLSAVYEKYTGKNIENAHDALSDTIAVKEILDRQEEIIMIDLENTQEEGEINLDEVLQEMSGMKNVVDYYGKLRRDEEGFLIYTFGKHKDKRVMDHLDYIPYIMKEPFPQQIKDLIREEQRKHATREFMRKPGQGFFQPPADDELPF